MHFSKIAILGPGLLGGSIALALRSREPSARIAIWGRRESALDEVRGANIADIVSADLEPVVCDAQLIVLCMPIGAMAATAKKIEPLLTPGAFVTDVGSVKSCVVSQLAPIFKTRAHFAGSHPMAGSEQTGFAAARADLFENAMCIITPDGGDDAAVSAIESFWKTLGCRVAKLSPADHDEIVARVSHLPHLLAAMIVRLAVSANERALDFSGPGFRDTTRVASGPPAMWAEILSENRGPLKKSLNAVIENLREVLKLLDADDAGALERFLAEAKTQRDALKSHYK